MSAVDVLSVLDAMLDERRQLAKADPSNVRNVKAYAEANEARAAVAELVEAGTAMALLYDGPECTEQEDIAASERFKRALISVRGTAAVDRAAVARITGDGA